VFAKEGDGVLIYPGGNDGDSSPLGSPAGYNIAGPIPSIRLKMIRQGLQDWTMFILAANNGLTNVARSEVAKVYGILGACTWQGCVQPPLGNGTLYWDYRSYAAIDQVRINVANALNALNGITSVTTGVTNTGSSGGSSSSQSSSGSQGSSGSQSSSGAISSSSTSDASISCYSILFTVIYLIFI